ncbi:hypothetical protein ACEWY4_023411 [Coilia grayii]|uniref:IF rod domain-containing protein n=1 Tax=Coilia grayii TaxID=363190 RepID=A0ABD1J6G4_9TELE
MSFISRSSAATRNFSSSSASGSPGQRRGFSSSASVFGGAGGIGSRISVANVRNLSSMMRPYVKIDNGSPVLSPPNDKETMQGLNDRLAGYLSKVRTLEESNRKLEEKIQEVLKKRGTGNERDWSKYELPLAALKDQLQDMTMENARLLLQIDNARLAADDFKVKFETEQNMRQGVEQDIAGLRKLIDDTHLSRMQLESQIEALRDELITLRRNHEEDVDELKGQINNSNVSVEMDNCKGEDLNETINKIRKDYEKAAQKNREDTEAWYKSKFDNISAEVSKNTEALQTGKSEVNDLRRQKQSLEIDLQALLNMNRSLEDSLNDTQNRTAQEIDQYNKIILALENELGQVRAQVERQGLDYQTLLNLKMKLEAEIVTYHGLLEGAGPEDNIPDDDKVDFSLEQALQAAPPPASLKRVLIINQEVVDGEVVSQTAHESIPTNGEQTWEEEEEELEKEELEDVAAPESVSPAKENGGKESNTADRQAGEGEGEDREEDGDGVEPSDTPPLEDEPAPEGED